MAEVFGLAAAGIGVAPIALELAKTVKKLKDYCRDIKSAREDIENFAAEVDALQTVLLQLEGFDMVDRPSSSRGLQRCHDLCSHANSTLCSVVSELRQGLKLQGRRTQLAHPLKKDRMKQLADRVAGAQRSLVLACNVYLMWQTRAQQQMVSDVFAIVQAQQHDHSRRFEDPLTGTSAIRQSLLALENENDMSISRRAPRQTGIEMSRARRRAAYYLERIVCRVWQACSLLATRGSTNYLRSYRIIPQTHPTYIAVERGDIETLQRLICAGEASIYDRGLDGDPLLLIAQKFNQMPLVYWLHQVGARVDSLDQSNALIFYAFKSYLRFPGSPAPTWQELIERVGFVRDNLDFDADMDDMSESGPVRLGPHDSLRNLGKPIDQWDCSNWYFGILWLFHLGDPWVEMGIMRSMLGGLEQFERRVELWHRVENGYNFSTLHPILRVLNSAFARGRDDLQRTSLLEAIAEFLQLAILDGADMHGLAETNGFPPLTFIMCYLVRSWPQACNTNAGLHFWVNTLAANGIDLDLYGAKETELWRKWRQVRGLDVPSERGGIFGFIYGPRPGDWRFWLEHPGDAYAGPFWDLIEHPERQIPGSWEEYDGTWDDEYFEHLENVRERRK